MAVKFSNNAKTTLSSGITSSATSIAVADASAWPTLGSGDHTLCTLITVADPDVLEIVKVTAISGNTLTVVRAQEGTTARAFASADKAELRVTAGLLEQALTGILTDVEINTGTLSGTHILGYSSVTGAWVNADPSVWFISKQAETISNITWSSASKALNITRANATFGPLTLTDVAIEETDVTFDDITCTGSFSVSNSTSTHMTVGSGKTQIHNDLFVSGGVYAQDFVRGEGNTTAFTLATNGRITTGENLVVTGDLTTTGFTSTGIDDNATSTAITIDSDERVGINITPTTRALEVKSIANAQIIASFKTGSGITGRIGIMDANTTADSTVGIGCTGNNLDFYAGAAAKATLSATGNLSLIGTVTASGGNSAQWNAAWMGVGAATASNTASTLALRDTTGSCKFRDLYVDRNDGTGAIYFQNDSSRYLYYDSSSYTFNGAPILASTGTSQFGGLTATGLITGRNNTSTVFNSSNDTGSISIRGDSTHPAVMTFHRASTYAVNFGLDGTNMKLGGWSAGTTKFQWDMSNGDFHADGNVTAYSTTVSDERLKDDVQLITSALDTVDSLRGVTYTWNAGSRKGKRDYGVIAQEVEQVIPEIVHETTMPLINGDEETIYKTVDYEKLCAVLINAVSELRAEVEALKNGSSD